MVSIGKENNYKMKKKLLLTLVVLLGMTSAMAADKISRSNFGINLGETKTFGINLFNECTNYVGFQMDLTLPDGLTVNKSGCSLTSRIIDENQELTIGKQGDNTYRLTSTSFSLTPIDGTSGDLINVSITASDTYQGGNATISNIQFATSNSERVTMNDVAFAVNYGTITFADEQVKALCVANWDTNGDGELDMSEAASVTDLGSVFYGSDITSFNELQYFTGLTNIGNQAFNWSLLTSVIIPNSVTSIGEEAFSDCQYLTSVTIPNSVTTINRSAFRECYNLTSVTIPNSVATIGEGAFSYCYSLKSINIPNGVTSIESSAFRDCSSLTSITIPSSVISIAYSAFYNCSGLASITVESGNTVYDSRYDCNAIIEKESKTLIVGCKNSTIPFNVTSIGGGAFEGCSGLAFVTIPESVTSIDAGAFSGCSGLTSVIIPKSVTTIGSSIFNGCFNLTYITVESENTVYDSRDNCNAIIEKATNTLIQGCQNTVIPNSVTSIGNGAFAGYKNLTSIIIPNSVTTIGGSAFSDCKALSSITIPNSVTSIGEFAFALCEALSSIEIPNSVTTIGYSAFNGCTGLTSVTIPNSLTSIGDDTFWACSGLTCIIIPENVTSIGNGAFYGCSSLKSMVVHNSLPLTAYERTFSEATNATLFVPKNSKTAYAAADYWKEFKTIKEFPDPDVNQDGYVDVVDVVDVARFVVGTPSDSFAEFLADLNGSGDVNVADAVVLVNEIAGDVNWSRPLGAAAVNDDILTLTRNVDQSLSFSLEGNSAYTAFQFDLMIPEGMDVTQMTLNSQRKQNHMLLYNKIGEGHYRVVVLSTSNQSFNETVGELLCIGFDNYPADGIIIDDIHFVTPQGNDLLFSAIGISGDTPTSISSVRGNNCEGKIYNLNGQSMTKTQKGLYIINGKKVVVK